MVRVLDIFHTQHSATAKKSNNKRRAKVPVYEPSSNKRKSKVVRKKSPGKFKKDSVDRTNSKTSHENSNFRAGRKRPFQVQRNPGQRKKRKI